MKTAITGICTGRLRRFSQAEDAVLVDSSEMTIEQVVRKDSFNYAGIENMNVILAKSAGFCFGVKRAVDTVYEQDLEKGIRQSIRYGPIIHNEEVVQ